MFRTFIIAVLAFSVGAIITYLALVIGVITVWDLTGVHDQDGGGAMALGLVIGPICAVFGGIICAILVPIWVAKRRGHVGPQTAEEKRRDISRLCVVGGTIFGGYIGYKTVYFIFWLMRPISIDSYWIVMMLTWAPTIAMALGALAGGLIVYRLTCGSKINLQKSN